MVIERAKGFVRLKNQCEYEFNRATSRVGSVCTRFGHRRCCSRRVRNCYRDNDAHCPVHRSHSDDGRCTPTASRGKLRRVGYALDTCLPEVGDTSPAKGFNRAGRLSPVAAGVRCAVVAPARRAPARRDPIAPVSRRSAKRSPAGSDGRPRRGRSRRDRLERTINGLTIPTDALNGRCRA